MREEVNLISTTAAVGCSQISTPNVFATVGLKAIHAQFVNQILATGKPPAFEFGLEKSGT